MEQHAVIESHYYFLGEFIFSVDSIINQIVSNLYIFVL